MYCCMTMIFFFALKFISNMCVFKVAALSKPGNRISDLNIGKLFEKRNTVLYKETENAMG